MGGAVGEKAHPFPRHFPLLARGSERGGEEETTHLKGVY